ncbi:GrpE-domain-containing protein [Daedalea quercina L-15889]|uniref:GrpE protein homolog, mitochondrial n=1 Tax=Daedalea quercina L-15889 TaxID=1314783 RepID=A0A165QZ29_9APHY|nr:GrpE-domain-containing protein [Daedalea quercina L-15889]
MFRSCRTTAPVRGVTRTAVSATRRRAATAGVRCYSDDKSGANEASEVKAEGKEGEGEAASAPSATSECEEKLKKRDAEVVDLTSRLRYLQADYLNLQRNAAREKEQTKDFAITRFASDLLETVDVLALALKSVPQSALHQSSDSGDTSSSQSSAPTTPAEKPAEAYLNELHTGVEMTHRLLLQTLFKYGVKPFDPTGDKFDPNRHEALFQAPIPDKEPGTVFNCQKIGYTIKDRVLRAAQVGVVQDRT